MVSLLGETEGMKMGQRGRKRERRHESQRALGVGLRETRHTKCLIRVKSWSVCVCVCEAEVSVMLCLSDCEIVRAHLNECFQCKQDKYSRG